MNDPRAVSRLWTSVCLAALLCGCEGATYVDHRVVNDTPDTLKLGYRSDEAASGWTTDKVWIRFEQELTVVPSHFD